MWLRGWGWGLGRQGDVCRQRDLSRKWDVSRQRDAVQGWGLVRWRRLRFRLRGSVTVNILLVSLYRAEIKTAKYRVSLELLYVTVNILLVSLYTAEIKTAKYRVSLELLYVTVNILLVRNQNH